MTKTPEEAAAAKIINTSKKAARKLRHGKKLKPDERQALENLAEALRVFGSSPEDVRHENV